MKIKEKEINKDMIVWMYYFVLATIMLSGIVFCAVFLVFGLTFFLPISIFLFVMFIYSIWKLVEHDMKIQKKKETEAHEKKEEAKNRLV